MIKNIKNILFIASVSIFGSVFLFNCEPEADRLGEQFFSGAEANVLSRDVIAYNINNNDTIKSDASEIMLANLGAFTENNFGMQKASYISQLRLSSYEPDFGTNAVVDSAVLVLKPLYATDSATTNTVEDYEYPDGNVPAKKVTVSYPVMKYGKSKINGNNTSFNIKVHEVTEFLGGSNESAYSNKNVAINPTAIGSKVFKGTVSSTAITKDSDNSNLWTNDVSLRIKLNSTFFQNKIIAKKGSVHLKDAANFTRYFNGVKISVEENDGYLFSFSPNNAEIVMYYKYDKTENGTTKRTPAAFIFPMGASNVHIGNYVYSRTDTHSASALSNINTQTGDHKLFVQGMGGPGFGIKLPEATVNELKEKFKNDKIGIMDAKIRVYTDEALWKNNYQKPTGFVFLEKDRKNFLPEFSVFNVGEFYNWVQPFDLDKNPAYYDLNITKTLKDIVETNAEHNDFIVNVGSFLTNNKNQLISYKADSRAYTPNRVVLVGSEPNNPNRIQLKLIYGTKK